MAAAGDERGTGGLCRGECCNSVAFAAFVFAPSLPCSGRACLLFKLAFSGTSHFCQAVGRMAQAGGRSAGRRARRGGKANAAINAVTGCAITFSLARYVRWAPTKIAGYKGRRVFNTSVLATCRLSDFYLVLCLRSLLHAKANNKATPPYSSACVWRRIPLPALYLLVCRTVRIAGFCVGEAISSSAATCHLPSTSAVQALVCCLLRLDIPVDETGVCGPGGGGRFVQAACHGDALNTCRSRRFLSTGFSASAFSPVPSRFGVELLVYNEDALTRGRGMAHPTATISRGGRMARKATGVCALPPRCFGGNIRKFLPHVVLWRCWHFGAGRLVAVYLYFVFPAARIIGGACPLALVAFDVLPLASALRALPYALCFLFCLMPCGRCCGALSALWQRNARGAP